MKKAFYIFSVLIVALLQAQKEDEIVMQIGNKKITVAEFERMYTKNLDLVQDPKQKDIDYYKDLFINYQLQLIDAEAKKYDKDWSFKNEFNRYRRELAEKYLSDPHIQDSLVREAYERMKKDVRVSHIMVKLPANPSPADTLKAYKKIMRIRKEIKNGLPFEKAAVLYSDDPSAVKNKGDIGWFTVFQTVYPFETAAYETPVGEIAGPVRTRFGYHLIKKEAERPAVNKVQVAQIVALKKNDPEKAKQKIQNIYRQLKRGEDSFENLARQFSEDNLTAKKGGVMRPFGVREMVPEFEEHAFALQKPGDISEPFETSKAWHIVKLLKKYPIPPFKDVKKDLENRVAKSDRSRLGRKKLMEKLRREFTVEMKGSLKPVYKLVDKKFFEKKWEYPKDFTQADSVLFFINKEYPVTYRDFINYLYRHQLNDPQAYKRKKAVVDGLFEQFKDEELFKYYENHLEKFYPDFARTVKEYHDGLLLFNYKTKEIWEKALKDSTGLQQFYETHKDRYRQREKARYVTIQTSDKKLAKKLYKAVKKGKKLEEIMQLAGQEAVTDVRILDKSTAEKRLNGKKAVLEKQGNKYVIKGITDIIPERIPPLKEIRGKVVSDYQQYLEQELLEDLKKKYPVKIYEETWNKLRAKYKH